MPQFLIKVLSNLFDQVDVEQLKNALTMVEPGRFRIRGPAPSSY
jgi:hypothetical protein